MRAHFLRIREPGSLDEAAAADGPHWHFRHRKVEAQEQMVRGRNKVALAVLADRSSPHVGVSRSMVAIVSVDRGGGGPRMDRNASSSQPLIRFQPQVVVHASAGACTHLPDHRRHHCRGETTLQMRGRRRKHARMIATFVWPSNLTRALGFTLPPLAFLPAF